jgi:hypothetical protein
VIPWSEPAGLLQAAKKHAMTAEASMTARVWRISQVRLWRLFEASVLISATLLFSSQLALAQFSQQGLKLVGTGAVGSAD